MMHQHWITEVNSDLHNTASLTFIDSDFWCRLNQNWCHCQWKEKSLQWLTVRSWAAAQFHHLNLKQWQFMIPSTMSCALLHNTPAWFSCGKVSHALSNWLRYSTGMANVSPLVPFMESELSNLCSSLGKRSVTDSLISSTAELSGARIRKGR